MSLLATYNITKAALEWNKMKHGSFNWCLEAFPILLLADRCDRCVLVVL